MKLRLQERGQSLVLIALAAVVLFGFSALAIDGSRVFSDRRNAQNAADTAALSAALAKIRGDSYADAALDRATSNGYANDTNSTVEIHLCNDPLITTACQAIPTSSPEPAKTNPANYIQVKITSILPATFARIIGRDEFENIVTAVAYAGPVEPQPLVNGAALAALAPNEPDAILGNGNIYLDINNSGIFSNSSVTDDAPPCQTGSMSTVGNGVYTVDTSIQVVGSFCQSQNTSVTGQVLPTSQIQYPPTINLPTPSITCSGNGSSSFNAGTNTTTFSPGNYNSSINLNSTGHIHFSPGNYCFNGSVTVGGTANIIANNVNFLIKSGEFRTSGTSTFTCNDMLVYINGGSGMHFNGNGGNYCNNVTFYAKTGNISWNGNVDNRFFAPTGGDYKNVLIYMPFGNTSPLTINGNSGNELTGTILAIQAPITISGNSGNTGFHSQIIGYTIDIQGNSNTVINYVPDEQYQVVDPSAIQLTK